MKKKVFIDGRAGTTGLQIVQRLERRSDIELMEISEEKRKDADERGRMIRNSDLTFLCLPDAAAREAILLAGDSKTVIIDASTAHRCDEGWTYGFPELEKGWRELIAGSKRIANPGCHASGFISIVGPLVRHGVVSQDYPFTCVSITGYSGGGKSMIADYEGENRAPEFDSPRQYGLTMFHKHLPEMQKFCMLKTPPTFMPIVADFYSGMSVSVPLRQELMAKKMRASDVYEVLAEHYSDSRLISVELGTDKSFLPANLLSGTNRMKMFVLGDEVIDVVSIFDNLGKGASGAAVQNMNLALGFDECESLI